MVIKILLTEKQKTMDILFSSVSDPELSMGHWFVHLEHHNNQLDIKIDEAFAPLVAIADATNEKFVKVHLPDLVFCLDFGNVSLHIVQYDIQKAYVRFELYVNDHRFVADIEAWRAIAFARAFYIPIYCSEKLFYETMSDISRSKLPSCDTAFLQSAIPFVRMIASDPYATDVTRLIAEKRESIIYHELAKRQKTEKTTQIQQIMSSLSRLPLP
ncbi:hypothetical protein KA013_04035 [Patescibacteria group bacterium]|nr:hypothetical protein [Patescibacteria group bacterium]